MGDEHRNQTLPLQIGHFSWLSFITTGLRPPSNLNGAQTFGVFFKKKLHLSLISFPNSSESRVHFEKEAEISLALGFRNALPSPGLRVCVPYYEMERSERGGEESCVELR